MDIGEELLMKKIVTSILKTDGEVNDTAKNNNNNIWCRARMFNFMRLQITEDGK